MNDRLFKILKVKILKFVPLCSVGNYLDKFFEINYLLKYLDNYVTIYLMFSLDKKMVLSR